MNDLISRQAAIDAVRASTLKYTGFMEMEMYTDDDAVEAINGVPSAQRWIPVTERLPEKSGRYLVQYGENSDYMQDILSYYTEEFIANIPKGWHSMDMWDSLVDYTVDMVAWMPLPEPYREVEE